jgi:hypothetical protein
MFSFVDSLVRLTAPPNHLHCLRDRIDNQIGTGVHLSPSGVEFDERRVALGDTTEVRDWLLCVCLL